MRILHCIYSFTIGGAEAMLVDIINKQIKSGEVFLIILNSYYHTQLLTKIDKRVKVFLLNRKPETYSILSLLKLNYRIFKIKPDVLHLHNSSFCRYVFVPVKKKILTIHDIYFNQKYYPKFDKLIAISEAVKDKVVLLNSLPLVVVKNGIDVESVMISDQINTKRPFRIINVARLELTKKGQDILINAIAILKEKYFINDIVVDFIGEGDSLDNLKKMVTEMHLENSIHFVGLKDRNYIYSNLKDYHLMCHPSRYEGFGLTIAEGMAAKIPVLVSKGDGPYEIIEEGKWGYFFNNGDVEECAIKILDIYQNYEQRCQIVEGAYKHVIENYSIDNMVKQYVDIYKQLIE